MYTPKFCNWRLLCLRLEVASCWLYRMPPLNKSFVTDCQSCFVPLALCKCVIYVHKQREFPPVSSSLLFVRVCVVIVIERPCDPCHSTNRSDSGLAMINSSSPRLCELCVGNKTQKPHCFRAFTSLDIKPLKGLDLHFYFACNWLQSEQVHVASKPLDSAVK